MGVHLLRRQRPRTTRQSRPPRGLAPSLIVAAVSALLPLPLILIHARTAKIDAIINAKVIELRTLAPSSVRLPDAKTWRSLRITGPNQIKSGLSCLDSANYATLKLEPASSKQSGDASALTPFVHATDLDLLAGDLLELSAAGSFMRLRQRRGNDNSMLGSNACKVGNTSGDPDPQFEVGVAPNPNELKLRSGPGGAVCEFQAGTDGQRRLRLQGRELGIEIETAGAPPLTLTAVPLPLDCIGFDSDARQDVAGHLNATVRSSITGGQIEYPDGDHEKESLKEGDPLTFAPVVVDGQRPTLSIVLGNEGFTLTFRGRVSQLRGQDSYMPSLLGSITGSKNVVYWWGSVVFIFALVSAGIKLLLPGEDQ
jgi:hypothetical protein